MLYCNDTQRRKKAVPGKCIICNDKAEVNSALGQIPFCKACWEVLDNEDELDKRIVWDV